MAVAWRMGCSLFATSCLLDMTRAFTIAHNEMLQKELPSSNQSCDTSLAVAVTVAVVLDVIYLLVVVTSLPVVRVACCTTQNQTHQLDQPT